MTEQILFSDLDGTLIFSAKHKQKDDIVIERKDGGEISCITKRQAELFPQISRIIPITTRSIEQYRRIDFARFGFCLKYALCDNGGTLLIDGEVSAEWSEWSRGIYENCREELAKYQALLERDPFRSFEVRLVDGLFLFTKSADPRKTLDFLGAGTLCECFFTGQKVYVVPKALNKGAAVKRLAEKLGITRFAAAGNSAMDISMLNAAQTAVFTDNITAGEVKAENRIIRPRERFSQFVCEFAFTTI